MSDPDPNVKHEGRIRSLALVLMFVDRHPRVGWYISVVVTLDLIMQLFELFK